MSPWNPFAALGLGLFSTAVGAAPCAFELDPKRAPVGEVFHYVKSNLDGSHASNVSVYVARVDRLESLKWDDGVSEATLVAAELDWSRGSVQRFESWRVGGDAPELRATLEADGEQLRLSFDEHPVQIAHWPWHSFDFDFASLNFMLPHRREPLSDCTFWRTDFVYSEPPTFKEIGAIELQFAGEERRNGAAAHRYTLSGPGLQHTRGEWWADARSGLLLEYRMPIPDEPGYDSVLLRLRERAIMSAEEWARFKRGER